MLNKPHIKLCLFSLWREKRMFMKATQAISFRVTAWCLHLSKALLSKATCNAFKGYILFSMFSGNQILDVGVASCMIYHLSYRNHIMCKFCLENWSLLFVFHRTSAASLSVQFMHLIMWRPVWEHWKYRPMLFVMSCTNSKVLIALNLGSVRIVI